MPVTPSTRQFLLTVSAGKRLIAKAVAALPQVKHALANGTIAIVTGTTNGYVAEELLRLTGREAEFSKESFFRGITVAPGRSAGQRAEGDVVIEKGVWIKGKDIFAAAPAMVSGDIIIKGANAVDARRLQAGIQLANPTTGTSAPILQAVMGKRVELVIPVGLEKRVYGNIGHIAARLNAPDTGGMRMLAVGGTIVTELEAIALLTGASAELVAAGGVHGAEGGCWLAVTGTEEELAAAAELCASVAHEPPFGG
jgi:hypothetical protein